MPLVGHARFFHFIALVSAPILPKPAKLETGRFRHCSLSYIREQHVMLIGRRRVDARVILMARRMIFSFAPVKVELKHAARRVPDWSGD